MLRSCVALLLLAGTFALAQQSPANSSSGKKCYVPTQRENCGFDTCLNNTCGMCTTEEQCFFPMNKCDGGRCTGKRVIDVSPGTITAAVFVLLFWAVLQAVASGGSGATTAASALFLGFPFPGAVIVSLCLNAGASLVRVPYSLFRLHPTIVNGEQVVRPVINYQILALLGPMSFLGTVWGQFFDQFLYELHRAILLVFVQGVGIPLLLKAAFQRFRRERREAERRQLGLLAPLPRATEELLASPAGAAGTSPTDPASGGAVSSPPTMNRQELRESLPFIPWIEVILLVISLVLSLMYKQVLQLTVGQIGWQLLVLIIATTTLGGTTLAYRFRLQRCADSEPDHPSLAFDWNHRTSVVAPILGITVGLSATMTSSGALVMFLVLMLVKLHPDESVETNRLMTLLTISIPIVTQLSTGSAYYVQPSWALLFLVCGGVGAVFSIAVTKELKRRELFSFLIGLNGIVQMIALSLSVATVVIVSLTNERYGVPSA